MAPIFVGSNDDDSRIRGNRVGFAISTANPGSASEGDIYFNSTDKQLRGYDGSAWAAIGGGGGGTAEFIASGSLSNGQTVILNSNGTVSAASTVVISDNVGTAVTFNAATTNHIDSVYDPDSKKVIIVYSDEGNSDKGTAIVGTVDADNETITFGSETIFNNASTNYCAVCYDTTNQTVFIGYAHGGDNQYGYATWGTISNNTVFFDYSTATRFEQGETEDIKMVYDPANDRVYIFYRDQGDSWKPGRAVVGTFNGNQLNYGSTETWQGSSYVNRIDATLIADGKVVVSYQHVDGSNYPGKAFVATYNGSNAIGPGSDVTWDSNGPIGFPRIARIGTTEKFVIVWQDSTDSNKGKYIVGTYDSSGSSISFGTAGYFHSGGQTTRIDVAYDSNADKIVVAYSDDADNSYGKFVVGTLSGTTITFGSERSINGNSYSQMHRLAFDTDQKRMVVSFRNHSGSFNGTSAVIRNSYVDTNLTTTNFIGFSDAAYTNGQTATVQMVGSVDDAQSGLTTATKHFVQNDGSLGTTAATPSVFAGTAISSTKIIVRK